MVNEQTEVIGLKVASQLYHIEQSKNVPAYISIGWF